LIKWRKWNNILHRDIGYTVAVLTIVYATSGIAVNHVADWNPNYKIDKESISLQPVQGAATPEMKQNVMQQMNLTEEPKSVFRPDEETIQLFYERRTITVDIPTGMAIIEQVRPRRVLFEFNQLHLNTPKRAWTYFADAYAVSLIIVAITGLFVLKGRNGITGRGAFFTVLGALIPAGFWIWYALS
jgi:uncharacterized protein